MPVPLAFAITERQKVQACEMTICQARPIKSCQPKSSVIQLQGQLAWVMIPSDTVDNTTD